MTKDKDYVEPHERISRRRHLELRVAVGKVLRLCPDAHFGGRRMVSIPEELLAGLWRAFEEE